MEGGEGKEVSFGLRSWIIYRNSGTEGGNEILQLGLQILGTLV